MSPAHDTREAWLRAAAADHLGPIVSAAAGRPAPTFHVSVGFPKGHRGRGRAVGQCWDGGQSADGSCHVFVCPTLSAPAEVLAVLAHEMFHATVGCAEKHKGAFARAMKAAGMVKPWTTSTPGPELRARLEAIAEVLGTYPHAPLAVPARRTVGSRLRLWECECGVKARVASDDFQATCGRCEGEFQRKGVA